MYVFLEVTPDLHRVKGCTETRLRIVCLLRCISIVIVTQILTPGLVFKNSAFSPRSAFSSFVGGSLKKTVFTLDAGLLARSLYPEGPTTGHLDTCFSWFPYVYKQMLRWFPTFQVATTCFSSSPPDLNLLEQISCLYTCKITTATG